MPFHVLNDLLHDWALYGILLVIIGVQIAIIARHTKTIATLYAERRENASLRVRPSHEAKLYQAITKYQRINYSYRKALEQMQKAFATTRDPIETLVLVDKALDLIRSTLKAEETSV